MFTEGALRPWEALARDHGTMLKREAKRGAGSSRAHAKRIVWDRVVAPGTLYVDGVAVAPVRKQRVETPQERQVRERAARARKIARSWVGISETRARAVVDKSLG